MVEKHVGSNYANKHKHNSTEFYVAFTNRLIVIGIIAIITELTFVGFFYVPALALQASIHSCTRQKGRKDSDGRA